MKRAEHESEYQKLLIARYGYLEKSEPIALQSLYDDPQRENYESEMLEWMKEYPNATFDELARFDFSFYEPLEIVDDEE